MKITSSKCLLRILALSVTILSAGTATAQDASPSESTDEGWAPVRHLQFKPEDVEGGRPGPGGEEIVGVPRAEHECLIEIRAGFEAEIVKTMENM